MSMEINHSYRNYKMNYPEQLKAAQERTKEVEKEQDVGKATEKLPVLQDEYISSEKSDTKVRGLYRLGKDENDSKKCTTNTDKVDREIEKLKEKKRQLEQQIKMVAGNEKAVKELEKKLFLAEQELSKKNNDTYRRQNAFVSE